MATTTTHAVATESVKPWWERLIFALAGLLCAVGSLWWATHDTPPARAANEAIHLANQGKKEDVSLAKEHTKQMNIAAKSGATVQMPGVVPRGRPAHTVGSEGQHFLAKGMDFTFNGQGDGAPAAVIAFRAPPVSMTGAFKVYGGGKTAWSNSWSPDPSPYPLEQLLEELRSSEKGVKWMQIHSNGPSTFGM